MRRAVIIIINKTECGCQSILIMINNIVIWFSSRHISSLATCTRISHFIEDVRRTLGKHDFVLLILCSSTRTRCHYCYAIIDFFLSRFSHSFHSFCGRFLCLQISFHYNMVCTMARPRILCHMVIAYFMHAFSCVSQLCNANCTAHYYDFVICKK